jgi:hypothetical protein
VDEEQRNPSNAATDTSPGFGKANLNLLMDGTIED